MHLQPVEIKTSDGLPLYGLISEARKPDAVLIGIHGSASNFYENYFMDGLMEKCPKLGVSVLSTNNRGSSILQAYPESGAALEHFEDCTIDLDGWIDFAKSIGYKRIILQGHSLGAEKVVYYMSKGKHVQDVIGVILLGPADSFGYNYRLMGKDKMGMLMKEAKSLVARGKGYQLLTSVWHCHGGVLPKGADSFLNFFGEGSECSTALPLRNLGGLDRYRKIGVPILVAIGDKHEYTAAPIKEALAAMKSENRLTECHQVRDCDHDFTGREKGLQKIIIGFLRANFI